MFNLFGMDSSLGVAHSEEEHVWFHLVYLIGGMVELLHPLFWDVGNVDVVLNGIEEIFNGFLEHVSLLGVVELLSGIFEIMEFLIVEGSFESIMEVIVPVGLLEVLIVLLDVKELVLEIIELGVVDMDSSFGLLDGILEDFTELLPLLHESFTLIGVMEVLIEFLKFFDL